MSSIDDDYRALTDGAGLVALSDRSHVELTGADRGKFLQNFVTNDVARLSPGQGCEAFVLDAKGHVLGHVLVFCTPQSLVLDSSPGEGAKLARHLDRYVIREDVEVADRSEAWSELLLAGAEAPQLLAELGCEPPQDMLAHTAAKLAWQDVWLRRAPLAGRDSFLIAGERGAIDAVSIGLVAEGATRCEPAALEAVRIEAGFPLYGRDISEKNLPQEVDRDALAINFKKGCYLGQETVARIDALGHVNRRLVCLRIAAQVAPPIGAVIRASDQPVGEITSAAWSPGLNAAVGLGYVRRGHDQPGLRLETDFGPAEVVAPPRRPL